MPTAKPRAMLTLDKDTHALLQRAADASGLSISGVVNKLLLPHIGELYDYVEWMDKQQEGTTQQVMGKYLLAQYGPGDLIAGIRRLDPKHKLIGDQFKVETGKKKSS